MILGQLDTALARELQWVDYGNPDMLRTGVADMLSSMRKSMRFENEEPIVLKSAARLNLVRFGLCTKPSPSQVRLMK